MKVDASEEQCSSNRQEANTEPYVETKPEFEIDLRIEEVPDEVVLKDEKRMEELDGK